MEPHVLTSSGRCLERTEIIALDGDRVKALLDENPEMGYKVANNLVRVVASRLQHTKQTTERMLSVIFHDLKAPLAAAESYNRLLLDGFVGELSPEQKNIVQRSSKRLSDLLHLIGNMIDFSRVDFGDFRTEEVCLIDVIQDCVETMRPLACDKGLQLVVEAPQELPVVPGTAGRLKQVITNLLSNAIKFADSGGVTVRVKDDKDHLQVDVIDTGRGIPAESLPRIFDGFYAGLDMEKRGAGLGLPISKRIIDSHGGRIWATSPCPETGKGSMFTFTLPKSPKQAE
jgi:signal transduction histidine kinase